MEKDRHARKELEKYLYVNVIGIVQDYLMVDQNTVRCAHDILKRTIWSYRKYLDSLRLDFPIKRVDYYEATHTNIRREYVTIPPYISVSNYITHPDPTVTWPWALSAIILPPEMFVYLYNKDPLIRSFVDTDPVPEQHALQQGWLFKRKMESILKLRSMLKFKN